MCCIHLSAVDPYPYLESSAQFQPSIAEMRFYWFPKFVFSTGQLVYRYEKAAQGGAAAAATASVEMEEEELETGYGPVQNVKGQVLELDLYDFDDGGIFDADDFLGRVLIPLERVLTVAEVG